MLIAPTVSGTSGCYVYCFFVQHPMLCFAGANIIIKGEKSVCRLFQCFMVLLLRCTTTVNNNSPHFNASYQGYYATFNLDGELIEGDMPKRQIKFIAAWTEIHKDELIANWELAINEEPLYKIEPLR